MLKINFYILLISTVLACKTNSSSSASKYEESKELAIELAFIQEEIPGTQGENAKTYITILFSELAGDKVKLEKLWFVGEFYEIQETDYRNEKTLKMNVTKSNFWNKSAIPEFKLYYKEAKKDVVQEINSTIKEPIYFP